MWPACQIFFVHLRLDKYLLKRDLDDCKTVKPQSPRWKLRLMLKAFDD